MSELILVDELVFDYDFYPRTKVDSYHIAHIAEAYRSGATLPPLIADQKSKCIVDGFHRGYALRRLFGTDARADVTLKKYKSRAEMFVDAMQLNGGHGRNLSTFDRAHCVILAERFGIEPDQIAASLSITVDTVGELRSTRVGQMKSRGSASTATPLKRTLRHMRDHTMTQKQVDAQQKLGGMEQLFYVNQIIILIENNLLDLGNERLLDRCATLATLLRGVARERKGAA